MQASNVKGIRMSAATCVAFLLLLLTVGCGGPSSSGGGQAGPPASGGIPELTDEIIRDRINDARVRDVKEETGAAQPIIWNFDHDEPKEIKVVERKMDGTSATLVLDVKTESAPGSRIHRKLAGQIRTEWQLETGWVLRRWQIHKAENISMTYKDFTAPPPLPPSPSPQNPNR